jgi:hypothetical protein
VNAHAFELVFAFDEVIQLGFRDKISIAQVKTFFEMDSHEEKIAEMVEKNKLREAKEVAKRRQTQIDKERQEAAKTPARPPGVFGGSGGYGGQPSFSSSAAVQSGGYAPAASQPVEHTPAPAATPGKGMQLKKAPKNDALVKQLEAEGVVQVTSHCVLSTVLSYCSSLLLVSSLFFFSFFGYSSQRAYLTFLGCAATRAVRRRRSSDAGSLRSTARPRCPCGAVCD